MNAQNLTYIKSYGENYMLKKFIKKIIYTVGNLIAYIRNILIAGNISQQNNFSDWLKLLGIPPPPPPEYLSAQQYLSIIRSL
jgi:hypothetical protein